jgi:putative ABC transport system permease protein
VVVGILHPSSTAFDGAVYTTIESVWQAHGPEEDASPAFVPQPGLRPTGADPDSAISDQVTAILVRPTGFIEANRLWQQFRQRSDAQAAFPGAELGALFDLIGQGERLLSGVALLVFGIVGLTLFLTIYNATQRRTQHIAVIRSLGGSRNTVFRVVLLEAVVIVVSGALIGRVIGYACAWAIGALISQQSAIPIVLRWLPQLEWVLWAVPVVLGLLAGMIPALMAYRVDVVEKLFPT